MSAPCDDATGNRAPAACPVDGEVLIVGMTRPELAQALVAVGPDSRNDDRVRQNDEFAAAETLEPFEREPPEFARETTSRHDRGGKPAGSWRALVWQLRDNLAVNPAYTVADLRRIPNPTLPAAGENALSANLGQMTDR